MANHVKNFLVDVYNININVRTDHFSRIPEIVVTFGTSGSNLY